MGKTHAGAWRSTSGTRLRTTLSPGENEKALRLLSITELRPGGPGQVSGSKQTGCSEKGGDPAVPHLPRLAAQPGGLLGWGAGRRGKAGVRVNSSSSRTSKPQGARTRLSAFCHGVRRKWEVALQGSERGAGTRSLRGAVPLRECRD